MRDGGIDLLFRAPVANSFFGARPSACDPFVPGLTSGDEKYFCRGALPGGEGAVSGGAGGAALVFVECGQCTYVEKALHAAAAGAAGLVVINSPVGRVHQGHGRRGLLAAAGSGGSGGAGGAAVKSRPAAHAGG